ncbi:aldo/keto reductase [Plantibacter sp. Mn2098]|uniref:aldo/keto reductase n=1 Tax=Plantibacter sp. Mn2098 TaxID=3395266 RepID=UPI003BC609C8
MTDFPSPARYDGAVYRRVGASGLRLPPISLGLWQNFGDERPAEQRNAILRRAFDRGVTHFDLANNNGTPYGSAERNLGQALRGDFRGLRDELVLSTKAGYDMWPGPYGDGGSRTYLLSSLDQSLSRLGVDHVDLFYSHRPDPETPIEETMGALQSAVQAGKARYVGISNYDAVQTEAALAAMSRLGGTLIAHQPSYSMLNRWIEDGPDSLLSLARRNGLGIIAFSPLNQGVLTGRYLNGVPSDSRAARRQTLSADALDDGTLRAVRSLNDLAVERGQTLAQMSLAWVLRDATVATALVGASSVEQLDGNLDALAGPRFDVGELIAIERILDELSLQRR